MAAVAAAAGTLARFPAHQRIWSLQLSQASSFPPANVSSLFVQLHSHQPIFSFSGREEGLSGRSEPELRCRKRARCVNCLLQRCDSGSQFRLATLPTLTAAFASRLRRLRKPRSKFLACRSPSGSGRRHHLPLPTRLAAPFCSRMGTTARPAGRSCSLWWRQLRANPTAAMTREADASGLRAESS